MLVSRKLYSTVIWRDVPKANSRSLMPGLDFWYWPSDCVGLLIEEKSFYSLVLVDGKVGWVPNEDLKSLSEADKV